MIFPYFWLFLHCHPWSEIDRGMVCRGLSWNAVATQLRRQCSRGLEKWLDRIPAGGCSCLTASNTYVICMVMGLWQGLCHVHIQIVFLLLVPVLSEIIIEALGDTVFGNMTLGSFRVPIYSYLIVYLFVTCWWERHWHFFLEGSMGDNPQKLICFAYYGLKTHAWLICILITVYTLYIWSFAFYSCLTKIGTKVGSGSGKFDSWELRRCRVCVS